MPEKDPAGLRSGTTSREEHRDPSTIRASDAPARIRQHALRILANRRQGIQLSDESAAALVALHRTVGSALRALAAERRSPPSNAYPEQLPGGAHPRSGNPGGLPPRTTLPPFP